MSILHRRKTDSVDSSRILPVHVLRHLQLDRIAVKLLQHIAEVVAN